MDYTVNINKLRRDMIDYYGTASFNGFPAAVLDLSGARGYPFSGG